MDLYFAAFILFVAVGVAVGASLLLVGYIDTMPLAFSSGWAWGLAVMLPFVGPIAYCWTHWDNCAKTGKRLIWGSALVAASVGALYGFGPFFAARIVAAHAAGG